jgi:hypothetical protein
VAPLKGRRQSRSSPGAIRHADAMEDRVHAREDRQIGQVLLMSLRTSRRPGRGRPKPWAVAWLPTPRERQAGGACPALAKELDKQSISGVPGWAFLIDAAAVRRGTFWRILSGPTPPGEAGAARFVERGYS